MPSLTPSWFKDDTLLSLTHIWLLWQILSGIFPEGPNVGECICIIKRYNHWWMFWMVLDLSLISFITSLKRSAQQKSTYSQKLCPSLSGSLPSWIMNGAVARNRTWPVGPDVVLAGNMTIRTGDAGREGSDEWQWQSPFSFQGMEEQKTKFPGSVEWR